MNLESQLREKIRSQGKAQSTADVYWGWVKKFILFAKSKRGEWVHPKDMGKHQVEIFLSDLANQRNVSPNTQNQAFSALCYLYKHVLNQPLEEVSALRAKAPQHERNVVDQSELVSLFNCLSGVSLLVAKLMYGSGFRIGEVGRIRIKDISFERRQIMIRNSKGNKDRIVGFPVSIHEAVRKQIESMRTLWKSDLANNLNGVSLPHQYGKKASRARLEFPWWYLLTSDNYSRCPDSGNLYRHHRDMGHIAREIKQAALNAGIDKRITSHCLRHSYCTHSLESGVSIHVLQKLMGHSDLATTESYLHVTVDGSTSAKSPLDVLV